MREELLVLAKAYPTISSKYELLVCVAGITADGKWRRIYPIPWEIFSKFSDTKFKKKQWISYKLKEDKPSDRRPESRKINFNSIEVLCEEKYKKIKKMLDERLTTLEDLQNQDESKNSLGVIKPEIHDFIWSEWDYYAGIERKQSQTTLDGKKAVRIDFPDRKFQYVFKCCPECPKEHTIMCEDWELGMLYLKMKQNHGEDVAPQKVKNKFFRYLPKLKHIYFVLGTHNRYPNTWLIISVIYPRKEDLRELEQSSIDEFF